MSHTGEKLSVDFIPLQVVTTVDTLQVSDGSLKRSNKTCDKSYHGNLYTNNQQLKKSDDDTFIMKK
jgi:hypothetical protein